MSTLLNLPREIREHIIEFVILHRDERPLSLEASSARADLDDGFLYFSRTNQDGLKWPASQPILNLSTSPTSLLLTNKVLNEETSYVMSRQSADANPELDILIVNEDELWPTWVYIPAVAADRPKVINVTIRMCGIAQQEHSGFQEEAELVTLWRFSSLLERILRCGWTVPRSGDADKHIHLDALNLNFLTPATNGKPILPESIAPHWAQHERQFMPDAYIHPYSLAMSLANWISVMLQYRAANIPFMHNPHDLLHLVDRIGTMKFKVDGALRHTEIIHSISEQTA